MSKSEQLFEWKRNGRYWYWRPKRGGREQMVSESGHKAKGGEMNIIAVIIDKVPDTALDCPLCNGVWHEISPYTGNPVSVVDCRLYVSETYVKPFDNRLEKCLFCPLTTEEEYRKAAK